MRDAVHSTLRHSLGSAVPSRHYQVSMLLYPLLIKIITTISAFDQNKYGQNGHLSVGSMPRVATLF